MLYLAHQSWTLIPWADHSQPSSSSKEMQSQEQLSSDLLAGLCITQPVTGPETGPLPAGSSSVWSSPSAGIKQEACWEGWQGGDPQAGKMIQARANTYAQLACPRKCGCIMIRDKESGCMGPWEKSVWLGTQTLGKGLWFCQTKQLRHEGQAWLICWWLSQLSVTFVCLSHSVQSSGHNNKKELSKSQFLTGPIMGEIKHHKKPSWAGA